MKRKLAQAEDGETRIIEFTDPAQAKSTWGSGDVEATSRK